MVSELRRVGPADNETLVTQARWISEHSYGVANALETLTGYAVDGAGDAAGLETVQAVHTELLIALRRMGMVRQSSS